MGTEKPSQKGTPKTCFPCGALFSRALLTACVLKGEDARWGGGLWSASVSGCHLHAVWSPRLGKAGQQGEGLQGHTAPLAALTLGPARVCMSLTLGCETVPQGAARGETGSRGAEAGAEGCCPGSELPTRPVGLSLDGAQQDQMAGQLTSRFSFFLKYGGVSL